MLRLSILLLILSACAGAPPLLGLRGGSEQGACVLRQQTFVGPPGWPEVVLLNVLHLGSAAYFQELQVQLESADLVMVEGIRADPAAAAGGPMGFTLRHRQLARQLGLRYQPDTLRPRATGGFWRNVDLSRQEYLSLARGVHLPQVRVPDLSVDLMEETFLLQSQSGSGLAAARRAAYAGRGRYLLARGLVAGAEQERGDRVSRARQQRALAALQPGPGRLVYCWGHAHGRGLARGLRARGYRLVTERWVEAFSWGRKGRP